MNRCILGCLALAFSSASALAAQITQTNESVIYSPTWGIGGIFVNNPFAQFDPTLGTLNSVTVQLSGQVTYMGAFKLYSFCQDPALCSANFVFNTGINFNAPGFPTTYPYSNPYYINARYTGWVAGTDLQPITHDVALSASMRPSSMAGYTGTGMVNVTDGVSEDSDWCYGQGGISCALTANIDLFTSLIYDYTDPPPVFRFAALQAPLIEAPEPFSVLIFGAGMLGLMGMRRTQR